MPSIPTRELTINYGSYTVNPDGQWKLTENTDGFTLTFSFLIIGASSSDLATKLAAARAAYRTAFQDLTVKQGTDNLLALKQSDGTGLEVRAEIIREEHVANNGRSMRLTARIMGGRPADTMSHVGLREFSTDVTTSPAGRKLVTLSGVYTASGTTGARAVYNAAIDALASATLSGTVGGGTFELIGKPVETSSYNDQTLRFSRTYHEVKFGQGGGGDNSAIVEQRTFISARRSSSRAAVAGVSIPGAGTSSGYGSSSVKTSGGRALPLIEVTARYEAWVPFSVSTNLAGVWSGVRDWLVSLMRSSGSGTTFALVSETPEYDYDENRIVATLVGVQIQSGVVRREFSLSVTDEAGIVLAPAWNGNPRARYVYQGPARRVETYRLVEEVASGGAAGGSAGGSAIYGSSSGIGQFGPFGAGGSPSIGGFSNFGLFGAVGGFPTFSGGSQDAGGSPGGGAANSDAGGGGSGGGVDDTSGGSSSAQVSDTTTTSTDEWGLDSPIRLTTTTHERVIERFTPIKQPRGFASTGNATG